jgi:hypothetical protein
VATLRAHTPDHLAEKSAGEAALEMQEALSARATAFEAR